MMVNPVPLGVEEAEFTFTPSTRCSIVVASDVILSIEWGTALGVALVMPTDEKVVLGRLLSGMILAAEGRLAEGWEKGG